MKSLHSAPSAPGRDAKSAIWRIRSTLGVPNPSKQRTENQNEGISSDLYSMIYSIYLLLAAFLSMIHLGKPIW